MGSVKPLGQWALLLVSSLVLAFGLNAVSVPAAFLIGPMVSAIALGTAGATLRIPRVAFIGAQAIIGCLVARSVTGAIVGSVLDNWPIMLGIVIATVVTSGVVGWLLAQFGTLPGTTAAWGSSPGGASAMVAMAEDFGADPRLVAFMQYFRVVAVVITASVVSRILVGGGHSGTGFGEAPLSPPFQSEALRIGETLIFAAVASYAGIRLRLPAGALLGPMVAGAVLHATGTMEIVLPPWELAAAYAALGWYIGLRFTPDVVRHAARAIPQVFVATLMLIALCGLSAWVLTWASHTDSLTAYLATSPGGLDSVTIIAVGSDANLPFVLALQTLRLFVVILTGPAVAKLITRYA